MLKQHLEETCMQVLEAEEDTDLSKVVSFESNFMLVRIDSQWANW